VNIAIGTVFNNVASIITALGPIVSAVLAYRVAVAEKEKGKEKEKQRSEYEEAIANPSLTGPKPLPPNTPYPRPKLVFGTIFSSGIAITALLVAFLHSQGPPGKTGDKWEQGIPGTLAVVAQGGGPQPLGNVTFNENIKLDERAVLVITVHVKVLSQSTPGKLDIGGVKIYTTVNGQADVTQEFDRNMSQEEFETSSTTVRLLNASTYPIQVQLTALSSTVKNTNLAFEVNYFALGVK
jgi:hypothetical protein